MMRFLLVVAFLLASGAAFSANFTVTISDPAELAGITYAREQYNATLPKNEAGVTVGALATDAAYMAWVMQQAAKSYARAVTVAPLDAARTKCMTAGDCTDAAAAIDGVRAPR